MNNGLSRKNSDKDFNKIHISASSAGLARSHRIIRTEHAKEILFMKFCSQIHLEDFKQRRSKQQREERRNKRVNKAIAAFS